MLEDLAAFAPGPETERLREFVSTLRPSSGDAKVGG